MGDTIVKGIDAGKSMIPSRVLYSHSYSIRDKFKITEILQHNQLGDFGTTIDSKGENKTGLFMTEYVKPGVFFPSFLTLQNPTAELLFHLLISLKASSYGAQTSITGSNIKNHIIGILGCKVEPPVTSYTIARDFELDKTGNIDRNVLTSFIIKEMIKKKVNEEDTFFIFDNEINRDIKESFSGTGGVKHLSLNTDALISRSSVEQVNELYEVLSKQIDQFFDKVFPEDDTKGKGSEKNAGKKSTK
jgi:CRISPR-associated protein Csc2